MKIKKLKKLSIWVMAFALTASLPAFCGYSDVDSYQDYDSQTLSLTLPSQISIEKASGSVTTAVVSPTDGRTLTITTPIALSYNITSTGEGKVSVSATAPISDGDGTVNALYGTATNAMTIVFTNTYSKPTSAAVTDAISSSPAATSNINAIAFTFTPQTPTATLGTAPTVSVEDNALIYEFDEGAFNLPFTVQGSSLPGTFSGHDSSGNYTATLTISEIDG